MLIQNLLIRPGNNRLQDAGRLDEQIAADFADLAARLRNYQTGHLDKKVKGRSNHYAQWSAENDKKIAYADRVAELASGRADLPAAPAADVPDRVTEEDWLMLPPEDRLLAVLAIGKREASRIHGYDAGTFHVERQSFHPDDWYLWSVAARRELEGRPVWDCWTLNLTTGGLNGGHYALGPADLQAALAAKKGIFPAPAENGGGER